MSPSLKLLFPLFQESKPQSLAALRSDCANMISSSLRYIKRSKMIAMNYEQYQTAIVQNHGIKLLWPHQVNNGIITNPSKLCADDIRILHRELELGTCRWVEVGQEMGEDNATEDAASSKKRAVRSDKGKPRKKAHLEDSSLTAVIPSETAAVSTTSTPHDVAVNSSTQTAGNEPSDMCRGSDGATTTVDPPSFSTIDFTTTSTSATTAPAAKRKRGRPHKNQGDDSTETAATAPKKRGRPKKTTTYKSSDLVDTDDNED
ncbi:hypothetical protein K435DRAFT_798619 [Dendrothele bispora CBS 962.96]|uniref:Uncharacterized protein n=1 Tax=Dendrothele bispora (strain CBS 962.96) TaxID=1314807 RepID=A0A4S8LYI9_DENBC|nr:hypothetical protein K435DRAFT_798619 [Dendrothele bispora CBS 962.96]